jgi:hypothetical protein
VTIADFEVPCIGSSSRSGPRGNVSRVHADANERDAEPSAHRALAILIGLVAPLSAAMGQGASQPVDYSATRNKFNQTAKRACPSHHIDFLTVGQYDEVLEGFLNRYPERLRGSR